MIEEALAEKDGAAKMKKLPYPEETIREYELDGYEVKRDITYVLRVLKDGVPYEHLIRRRSSSNKLIVFHNGAVAEGHVSIPVFQRHSWIERLKTSCIFCMAPRFTSTDCCKPAGASEKTIITISKTAVLSSNG